MAELSKTRPGGNMRLFEALQYKLPLAGVVSILHRVSGLIMVALLPFIVWMFDASVSSEISFDAFTSVFAAGVGILPGWFVKLVALGLIWAYLHHLAAGVRHLWMDATHSVSLQQGKSSAVAAAAIGVVLTLLLGAKLFGLY